MTEIYKDNVTAEEWQRALLAVRKWDILIFGYNLYSTIFTGPGFELPEYVQHLEITAIRKAIQTEEQADTANEATIGTQLSDKEVQEQIDKINKTRKEDENKAEQPKDLDGILVERKARYGAFNGFSYIAQQLKNVMRLNCPNEWQKLSNSQKEALEMIMHKISRILNGDPNYVESWRDISGYAELVVKELGETEGATDGVVQYKVVKDGQWTNLEK